LANIVVHENNEKNIYNILVKGP